MTPKTLTYTSLAVLSTLGAVVWAEVITVPKKYGDVVHVTYWEKWTEFERDAMKAVVDKYNSTEGAKKHIFVDFMPVSQIEDKTIVATSGGLPPDISGLSTISLAAFADNNALTPLDDLCKQYVARFLVFEGNREHVRPGIRGRHNGDNGEQNSRH